MDWFSVLQKAYMGQLPSWQFSIYLYIYTIWFLRTHDNLKVNKHDVKGEREGNEFGEVS